MARRLAARGCTSTTRAPRARRNVAHHYDLSDQLYELFLDRDRQYSCAYFLSPDDDIDTAQLNKRRHIAAKLLLRPGQKVLDIGCGWGGLALYLAARMRRRRHRADAFDRAAQGRAAPRRRGRACRIASAFTCATTARRPGNTTASSRSACSSMSGSIITPPSSPRSNALLAPDGVALLHSIGRKDGPGATNPWLRKYIFPGGYSPALSEVLPVVEQTAAVGHRHRDPAPALRRDAAGLARPLQRATATGSARFTTSASAGCGRPI